MNQARTAGKFARSKLSVKERIEARLDKSGDCWVWQGALSEGYGSMGINGKNKGVHRAYYEIVKGAVPEGLELDHLCRNRACANPDHLEAVPHHINTKRGMAHFRPTHCKRGHPLSGSNVGYNKNPYTGDMMRYCKKCHVVSCRRNQRTYQARKRLKDKQGE